MLEATNQSCRHWGRAQFPEGKFLRHSQCLLQQLEFTVNLSLKASSTEVNSINHEHAKIITLISGLF